MKIIAESNVSKNWKKYWQYLLLECNNEDVDKYYVIAEIGNHIIDSFFFVYEIVPKSWRVDDGDNRKGIITEEMSWTLASFFGCWRFLKILYCKLKHMYYIVINFDKEKPCFTVHALPGDSF